ncbi:putative type I restriction enzymeP M protein [Candidatus Izimaplasma bacterium HR1]|uniref:restriction endonuclease subunit M n=1 Tax=Candidatus Izimoplasma sp. HR1 TaxID=1541959 RepID=UPI0004F68CBF|nr:putative type I restriction enzymeP M protein [Candidatus Izimaplasma bacterium HR1]
MKYDVVEKYLDNQKSKIVEVYDFASKKVKYTSSLKGMKIRKYRGDEEVVRSFILAKLVNELGYKTKDIEIEKEYDIGRPKVNKPRIDVVVKDPKGDPFLFMELKSASEYDIDKDEIIEKQLYNLASQEIGMGNSVKYLVLLTADTIGDAIVEKCMIIDYQKYSSFSSWVKSREYVDTLPERYGKPQKIPFIKSGKKDLDTSFSHQQLDNLRKNLHNVLWGGGGTDDNDIFSSLVNIILAKIQDESEKKSGEKYDFQIFSYKNGESFDSNEVLFERINGLYRRALKQRMNIVDDAKVNKSYVIDENKFSLNKLKYTISELERFSFVDGKNSLSGKDILGDFFEGIIRDGFKQSKGQFFTHINIVKFLLWGLQLDKLAINKINNELELPFLIDPSAGSGTFLIEYMRFITENVKRRFKDKIEDTRDVEDMYANWFLPDHRENKWASKYIYGVEINFNLGTATKVNMILHGDGSTNIFVKDGLSPFNLYNKETAPNFLKQYDNDPLYNNKKVNNQFDCIISNPPFSVNLDNDTKKNVKKEFIFGSKKNSENLFIERWYQLLKPKGRFGVVLPDSVFDTTENKYIRLFIYKYFNVKAVVSLPQLAFQPYTSTKTSLLFAQKKEKQEICEWNKLWSHYTGEYSKLKTRVENLIKVYVDGKSRSKYPSIKNLSKQEDINILTRLIVDFDLEKFETPEDYIAKYRDEIDKTLKIDNDTKDLFGRVNTWWVFSQVAKDLDQNILMIELENLGYKRTTRGEKIMPNDLYRTNENGDIIVDDGKLETALDHLRGIVWQ